MPQIGYKSIMVPLEESDVLQSTLTTALLVARHFESYIEGLCVQPLLAWGPAVGFDGGIGALAVSEGHFEQEQSARTRRLHEIFEAFIRDNALPAPIRRGGLCARYVENKTPSIRNIGQRSRAFDLIVVGRPTTGARTPVMNTLETVLFESGRPVLIAPQTVPQSIGRTVVIAWNGSTETARAIDSALPFIQTTERVIMLTVEGALVPGPTGEDIAENLRRHGITVEIAHLPGKRSPDAAGTMMLQEATRLGADLLIKGAYTQGRLRQMIFGSATSQILHEAQLPVLMAH